MLHRTMRTTIPLGASVVAACSARAAEPVDLMLVLAIDGSGSLTDERITLQRQGHARAVASARFVGAIAGGYHGRVALTAIEWSNHDRQTQIVPWTVIVNQADANGFADVLLRAPRPIPGFTSISGAIDFSVRLFATAPHVATRMVIDISGNGTNNDGRPVAEARDDAVAAGVTINGLPILDVVGTLDRYYAEEVIGGPRAFSVVARDAGTFAEAVLRKLLSEVAALPAWPGRA